MKTFKKFLAVLLAMAMVVAYAPSALADEGEIEPAPADAPGTSAAQVTIGGETIEYETIDAAVAAAIAASSAATIKLLDDCSTAGFPQATVNTAGVTFDLNGKTLSCSGNVFMRAQIPVTVDDTSTEQNGKILCTAADISANGFIYQNKGNTTFTLNAGTIEATGAKPVVWTSGSKSSNIVINGGTVKNNGTGAAIGVTSSYTPTVTINGGTFYGDLKPGTASSFVVFAGTFTVDPSKITGITVNGTVTQNADNTYTVSKSEPEVSYTINGGEAVEAFYDAAMDAVKGCGGSAVVTLLKDAVKHTSYTSIAAGTTVTLDLNGHKLTNDYKNDTKSDTKHRYFSVNGILNLTDSKGTGVIYGNEEFTGTGCIAYMGAAGAVNVISGNYKEGGAATEVSESNVLFTRASGAEGYNITGGFFSSKVYSVYYAADYISITVGNEEKADYPYSVTNTYYTLTYDTGAGSFADTVEPELYPYLAGYTTTNEIAVTEETVVPSSALDTFSGWNTESDGTGTAYQGGDTLSLTADLTLYAQYETGEAKVKDVTTGTSYATFAGALFAANNSDTLSLLDNITETVTIGADRNITLDLNGKTLTGEEGKGSALTVEGRISICDSVGGGKIVGEANKYGGALDITGGVVSLFSGTLEGKAPNHGGAVYLTGTEPVFNLVGGTVINSGEGENYSDEAICGSSTSSVITIGQENPIVTSLTIEDIFVKGVIDTNGIIEDNNIFAGCFTSYANAEKFMFPAGVGYIANTDADTKTEYPYTVGAAFTVYFENCDGAINPNRTTFSSSELPVVLQDAAKESYSFDGWYTAKVGGQKVMAVTVAQDTTLYAHWTATPISITYVLPEGAVNGANPATFTIETETFTLLPASMEGLFFMGWFDAEEGGNKVTEIVKGTSEPITLYASFAEAKFSVQIGEGLAENFVTIEEAFAYAVNASAEQPVLIKLLDDSTYTGRPELRKDSNDDVARDITIDLNGFTISREATTSDNSGMLLVGKNSTLTITGDGTMIKNDTATDANKSIAYLSSGAKLIVEGGTFLNFTKANSNASGAIGAEISGGEFSFNPKDILADGCVSYKTANETYKVVAAAAKVTHTGETGTEIKTYAYLKSTSENLSALDNVQDGDTLKLLKDATATYEFDRAVTFTLELGGYTYENIETKLTATEDYLITVKAESADVYTIIVQERFLVSGIVGEYFGMDFFFNPGTDAEGVDKLIFKVKLGAGEEQFIIGKLVSGTDTDLDGCYLFEVGRINAQRMADVFAGKIYACKGAEDKEIYELKAEAGVSIANYANMLLADETLDPAMVSLVNNMLYYGAMAQNYTGWNTENLAINVPNYDATKIYFRTPAPSECVKKSVIKDPEGPAFLSATLFIDDQVSIGIKVKGDPYATILDVVRKDGQTEGCGFDLSRSTIIDTDITIVYMDRLLPTDFDAAFTFTTGLDGQATNHTVTYSVNSYVYDMINSTDLNLSNLVKAIYNFGVAAEAYVAELQR